MFGFLSTLILSLPATGQIANTLGQSVNVSSQAIGAVIRTLMAASANSNGFFEMAVDKVVEEIEKKVNEG